MISKYSVFFNMWNIFFNVVFVCMGVCLLCKDMVLLASMGPPGGGRTHISDRFQSRFSLINMTFPNVSSL